VWLHREPRRSRRIAVWKVDLRTRTLVYEAAMARLAERYSDDTEAAIFYALALNEAVDLNDKTYAKQFKAAAILQAIEAKQPNHPGIPHYIIHSLTSQQ
jgi:hypothetical protein